MELRIIESGPGEAAANMATDRALIEEVSADPGRAVLRWYSWDPPAFSLGYGQKPESVLDLDRISALSIPFAKRPTGGSLVYHENDQSYSFTVPRENPWGIVTSCDLYRFVSRAWIDGFRVLGIEAAMPPATPKARDVPEQARRLCLAFASPGDLLVGARKIGGSAQRRLKHVWQQQGFFLLRPAEVPDCFTDPVLRTMMKESSSHLAGSAHPVEAAALRKALGEALRARCEERRKR
jgi:lipoate-protein ligase A